MTNQQGGNKTLGALIDKLSPFVIGDEFIELARVMRIKNRWVTIQSILYTIKSFADLKIVTFEY